MRLEMYDKCELAKNDMDLLVYKILRYLYGCNKAGKAPTFSDMFDVLEFPSIPQIYLAQILQELIASGYIAGCSVRNTKDGTVFQIGTETRITLNGVAYLNENSAMKKAESFAGRAFELLLDGILSTAMTL